jgi:hypothetical protein
MPIIRRTRQSRQIAYGIQHWPVLQQTRGDEVARCALVGDGFTTRPVLYTVGDLSALSCSLDDGHNDARNMLSHQ